MRKKKLQSTYFIVSVSCEDKNRVTFQSSDALRTWRSSSIHLLHPPRYGTVKHLFDHDTDWNHHLLSTFFLLLHLSIYFAFSSLLECQFMIPAAWSILGSVCLIGIGNIGVHPDRSVFSCLNVYLRPSRRLSISILHQCMLAVLENESTVFPRVKYSFCRNSYTAERYSKSYQWNIDEGRDQTFIWEENNFS